ncbi:MAG TPA: FHA domain-containing protein [Myxococcales bacterium]|nr:FHA domain-containing protein [Myxococcales bacterium]
MDCPRCGATNDDDAVSCLSCGTPLREAEEATRAQQKATVKPGAPRLAAGGPPRQCPNCMTLNAATFKFCARCGTPLGAGAAPAPAKPAVAPLARPAPAKTAPPVMRPVAPKAPAAPVPQVPPAATKPPAPAPTLKPPVMTPVKPAVAPPTLKPPVGARPAPPPPPKPVAGVARPAVAPLKPIPVKPRARLSAIARDGSRSADFVLLKDETKVGRAVGDGEVKLDKDPFIAPVHAVFKFDGAQLLVQDFGSPNGVFLWLKERKLESGDELRIGRQRLRVEWMPDEPEALADQPIWGGPNPGYTARVVQLLEGGGEGDVFPLKTGANMVGRGTGDVSFPSDGYVSSKHATITVGEGVLNVKDLGSANGTFVRVNGEAKVDAGDLLLVGEQILRVDPA